MSYRKMGSWARRLQKTLEDGTVDEQVHEGFELGSPDFLRNVPVLVELERDKNFAELFNYVVFGKRDHPLLVEGETFDTLLKERAHDFGVGNRSFDLYEARENRLGEVEDCIVELSHVHNF